MEVKFPNLFCKFCKTMFVWIMYSTHCGFTDFNDCDQYEVVTKIP